MNTAVGSLCGGLSWFENTHVDALGFEAAYASSGRLFYVHSTDLYQVACSPENRAMKISDSKLKALRLGSRSLRRLLMSAIIGLRHGGV